MLAQQTLGGITGEVSDSSGGVIPNATVTIVGEQTGLTRTVKSGGAGEYLFPNLPIGTYTLTYSAEGYELQKTQHINVQADRTASVNASLKVGASTTTVEVEASPLMNAVDTTNGYVLDSGQIESAPLPTGSFTGLAILSPGVNAELSGGTGANSGLGNAPIWANGQRDTSNSFLLNGVDASNLFNGKSTSEVASARVVNNTGVGNQSAGGVEQSSASVYLAIGQALPTPAPETIEEVRVNASMYDAQQGSTSGAHIDLSTRAGTNLIHGNGYIRRGTDWLNAAPFFFKQDGDIPANEKVPELHRYTAGGSIGAPIIKDKLFGYLAYQHTYVGDQEIGISRLTVPSGLTDARDPQSLVDLANKNFGTTLTAADISPVALKLMQYKFADGSYLVPSDQDASGVFPTSSIPDNASIPGTSVFKADQAVANLDWNVSPRNTLAAKYYYQHDPLVSPYAYSNTSGFTQHLDTGSQVFSINDTFLVKPNLSVVGTVGVIREKAYGVNDQPFSSQDAGINSFGSSYMPGISIVDVLGTGPQNPNGLFDQSLNIGPGAFTQAPFTGLFQNRIMPSGNAIWTLGKHTLTMGTSYSYTQLNVRDDRTNKGFIATASFADFLAGQISFQNNDFTTTSFLLGNANRYYRANQVGSYVQDKFQIKPTLSLTAGVRYDWNGGLTEKYGKIYNFEPSQYQFNDSCLDSEETSANVCYPSNGFVIAGNNPEATKGVSNTTLTGRQWGFAPRIGAAWQPKKFDNKVVVRSGVGIYYDRGELFAYLSPGYASGEVTGGPFGVNQAPPFVNAIQCPGAPSSVSPCTPDSSGTFNLSNPWGVVPGTPPTGRASDITNYLSTPANIAAAGGSAQIFTLATYDRKNKLPYTINFTLDVQWQPRNDVAVTLGYVGNLGRHQVVPIPFNQAQIATAANPVNGQTYTYGYSVQQAGSAYCYYNCAPTNLPNGQPYLYTPEGGNIDLRVPYLGYSAESEKYSAAGISAYNALQAHIEKHMSHGFQVGASYTYSHALDEQSALGLFYNGNNPLNLRGGYASSDFDRTHVINFTYSYKAPNPFSESSLKGKFLNDWALNGITIIQGGQPYSIIDYSGAVGSIYYGVADGITNPIVPLAKGCTAKSAKTGKSGAFGNNDAALKASCFTLPLLAAGSNGVPSNDPYETTFTSGQRNIFRQAYQKRADISLAKTAQITERFGIKYTFDVFNLTNTTSFDIPKDNVDQNGGFNPTPAADQPVNDGSDYSFFNAPTGLGTVSRTIGAPRQIQMSLHLNF